jgi:hypothetical protein
MQPMKCRISLAVASLCAIATVALAQEPQMPTPGPEHAKLAYFAGKWTSDAEMKPMPPFPGGKMTSTSHSEMFPGGFFLVTHSSGQSAMGPMQEMEIMGYDPTEKVYTYDSGLQAHK